MKPEPIADQLDDELVCALAQRAGLSPAQIREAQGSADAAIAGQQNCLLLARESLRYARDDLYMASMAKCALDADGKPIPNTYHKQYHDYETLAGARRRKEYNDCRSRFKTTTASAMKMYQQATWFSTIPTVHAARHAAAATHDAEDDHDQEADDSQSARAIMGRLDEVYEKATSEVPKRTKRRNRRDRAEGVEAVRELIAEGVEVFGP